VVLSGVGEGHRQAVARPPGGVAVQEIERAFGKLIRLYFRARAGAGCLPAPRRAGEEHQVRIGASREPDRQFSEHCPANQGENH